MKKNITVSILLVLVLICSCLITTACSRSPEQSDKGVEITLEGASKSNKVKLHIKNVETQETTKIEISRWDKYTSFYELETGEYVITKVKSNNKKYEITLAESSFSVNNQNPEKIVIEIAEKDVSGTLSWFLKNNAFTLIAIVGLCIALGVVKWKKNRYVSSNENKMQ